MIRFEIIEWPAMADVRAKAPQILTTLTAKMESLMIRLAARVVGESIPAFFPRGAKNISASVRAIPPALLGTMIHGEVQAGGPLTTKVVLRPGPGKKSPVDYAMVQEYGGTSFYNIFPFYKKALAFVAQGNPVVVRSVRHPPLEPRPFMRSELDAMSEQIRYEMQKALQDVMGEKP